jgi:hypothetical protein
MPTHIQISCPKCNEPFGHNYNADNEISFSSGSAMPSGIYPANKQLSYPVFCPHCMAEIDIGPLLISIRLK